MKKTEPHNLVDHGQFLVYSTEDGRIKLDVRLEDESVWLTQQDMAGLFQITPQNITPHLKSIYEDEELQEAATCKDFLQVQKEGGRDVTRLREFHNSYHPRPSRRKRGGRNKVQEIDVKCRRIPLSRI